MYPQDQQNQENFTYEDFRMQVLQKGHIIKNRYKIIKKLDPRGYVFKVQDLRQGRFAAMKLTYLQKYKQHPQQVSQTYKRLSRTQPQLMNKVDSEYVIKCYQTFLNKQKTFRFLIMELCEGPTLYSYIIKKREKKIILPFDQALKIFYQIALGIYTLHKQGIMHRDLHANNIMEHNGKWMIIDLGYSKLMKIKQGVQKATYFGRAITMAPELLYHQSKYGLKIDIWSLGIILFFILTGGIYPFIQKLQNPTQKEVLEYIIARLQVEFKDVQYQLLTPILKESKVKKQLKDFLGQMLQFDHKKRLNINQVLTHQIFVQYGVVHVDQKPDQIQQSYMKQQTTYQQEKETFFQMKD